MFVLTHTADVVRGSDDTFISVMLLITLVISLVLLICGLEIRHVGLDTLCADADAVMSWAAEHPEPVYPTWGEWFAERGDLIKLWRNIRVCSEYGAGVIGILYEPIPADIAQKLGIEPKEDV